MQTPDDNRETYRDLTGDELIAGLDELQALARRLRNRCMRLREAGREREVANRALKTLSRCIESMTRATDEAKLLGDICHIVTDVGGYRMAWIGFAASDDRRSVRPAAWSGCEEGYLKKVYVTWSETDPRGHGPAGTAIRTGGPALIRNVTSDPAFAPWREEALEHGYRSVLGLPLCGEGSAFGAITIYSERPDAFDTEEVALLGELASELAYGITALRARAERARAERELEVSKAQAELYLDLMGHDINNLNQAAMGFLELALEKLQSERRLEPGDESLLSRPLAALENSSELIANVRKLQQERSGGLADRVIDVNSLLEDVCRESGSAPGRDVFVDFKPSCTCRVIANDLLKDVFANIVGNAIKHSAGRVTVDVSLACVGQPPDNVCRIAVEDNGPGIPDREKRQLLAAPREAPQRMTGKGLGMYIVLTLLEDYGGRLRIEDRVPGDYRQGSRFIVELPATAGMGSGI